MVIRANAGSGSVNLLAVCSDMHKDALKSIKKHLLDKHGLVSTVSLRARKQKEVVPAARPIAEPRK